MDALVSLKDIDGVYGSFVVDSQGQPKLRDVPVLISNQALCSAGPRIARLWLALPEDDEPEFLEVHFASHKLYVSPLQGGSLCLLVASRVEHVSLAVAVRWVRPVLEKTLAESSQVPSPQPVPPASEPPDKPAGDREIVYRGRRYSV